MPLGARSCWSNDGVMLLSPGAPSFPRYRDYVERGRHFAKLAGFDPDRSSAYPRPGRGLNSRRYAAKDRSRPCAS